MFHSLNKKCESSIKSHLHKLKEITLQVSSDLLTVIVVSDTSIKKHVAMLIAYIHAYSSPVIETIYHVVNIISTETELFTIRCSINQATHLLNTRRIVIISDFIYMAKRIKDSSSYLYQIHLAAIFCEFRKFFKRNIDNFIEFWDCPSHCNWGLHLIVDKETKSFNPIPIFPCKFSQDFSRKNEYDSILNT